MTTSYTPVCFIESLVMPKVWEPDWTHRACTMDCVQRSADLGLDLDLALV